MLLLSIQVTLSVATTLHVVLLEPLMWPNSREKGKMENESGWSLWTVTPSTALLKWDSFIMKGQLEV